MKRQQNTKLEYGLAGLILIAAGIQLFFSCYHAWPFTTDDAYISWRYAYHLAHGDGLLWSPTHAPVEGYSNFLWVLFTAFIIKLNLPIAMMVKALGCISLAAMLAFLYQLSRTFLSPLAATLPVYIVSHYIGVIWWGVSGLETAFFMALVVFVVWQSMRAVGFNKQHTRFKQTNMQRYNPAAWIACCIGLTVLALTRFEGIIWCCIVLLFIGCQMKRTAHEQPSLEKHWREMGLVFLLCFIMPYSLYFGWRLYYFKQFLPNSYACKIATPHHVFQLIQGYLPIAFPCLVMGLPYFFARNDCRHLLLWLPSLIYALLLLHADPMVAHYNRLFLGAFCVLSIIPALGAEEFFSYFHFQAKNNALASTVVILLFTYLFIPTHSLLAIDTAVQHYQERSQMRLQIARYINHNAPQRARILLADCGLIPFFSRKDIQFIDSLCLNNRDMSHLRPLSLYAKQMRDIVKPTWVVATYYPHLQQGNALDNELQKIDFFSDYTLIKRYQSHRFLISQHKPLKQAEDYVYLVYKRQHG